MTYSRKQKRYIPDKARMTEDGLPIDAKDWTEADWKDLHEAIENIKRKVRERHANRNDGVLGQ